MQKNFYLGLKKISIWVSEKFLSGSTISIWVEKKFQKKFYLVRRGSRPGSIWHLKFSIRLGAVRVTTKASDRPKGIVGKVSASFPQPAS